MAEVTKPIALDESFNTTESTPRSIADVLAEGLDNIAESVVPRAATEIPIQSGSSTNTKDYIDSVVESGSNTNGNYIKYKDGTMICTKTVSTSVLQSNWNSWGSLYESDAKALGDFAVEFYAVPVVNLTIVGNASFIERLNTVSKTGMGNVVLVRPTIPSATQNFDIQVIAIGRWKA